MAAVRPDTYTWMVTYQNGEALHEFDGPGTIGHGFAEVDSAHVEKVAFVRDGVPAFVVNVPEGAAPVMFRRRSIQLALTEDQEDKCRTVHCIGWKSDAGGVYLFVFGDGSVLLSDDVQAV